MPLSVLSLTGFLPLRKKCLRAAVVSTEVVVAAAVDIHDASLTAAAGNILLVDVDNACLVVQGHSSF